VLRILQYFKRREIVMDIKSLQMFQHLAQNLHFGKTAQIYFVSPSTLSRIIQRLENELGCQLFLRDNRSVQLTEAGQKFLQFTEQQLAQWQSLQQEINHQQIQLTGKLHIYCSVTAAYSHLPPLLDKFRQQHPQVEIMLTTGDAADALEQIQQKTVDIAIAAYEDNFPKSLFFHNIAKIPLTIIAPTIACKVQQQIHQQAIRWQEIPIILPEHGTARKRFEQWFRKKQLGKANVYATVAGHEALVSMVALGCGVGIAPQVVVDNSPVKERVENLTEDDEIPPLNLGICCLKTQQQQPLIKAFFNATNLNINSVV
jgi:LysR family positive regulator for ilvC